MCNFKLFLKFLILSTSTTDLGKLFNQLIILTKNECLRQLILGRLGYSVYAWLVLVARYCLYSNTSANDIPLRRKTVL
jgi:hypothetical protein